MLRRRRIDVFVYSFVVSVAHVRSLIQCKSDCGTNEDFIDEMFSEIGMEQDHDIFHVV